MKTAIDLQKRTSTKGGVSPHELYFERKPKLAHLRVFGNMTYVHVLKEKRMKLDPNAEICIFVSY